MSTAVGLDIGNSRCVIAVSTDGIADAILNEASKRETPTVVHFAKNHRLFGSAAASFLSVSPASTNSQPKDHVGRPIKIEVEMGGGKRDFTPVQFLAMLLSHLRRGAGRTLGSEVSDCVIGVPGYFSKEQKNAYRDAAWIAGWRPRALLDEGDATALVYATERLGDAADGRVVAFVDIGHSGTQISVVRFDGEKRHVVSEASDENLGGRDFDRVLFRFFQRKIKKEYAIDVVSNAKAKAKLWIACEKAKTVLSANREAQVSLESLMDDTDVKGQITRVEFEKKSLTLIDRIAKLFYEALSDADCDIHSVELVGSGSRIPAISRRLTEIFGREMSRTINGSECVARGCALFCEELIFNGRMENDLCEYVDLGPTGGHIPDLQRQEEELEKMDERHESAQRCRNDLESFIYQERSKRSKGNNGVSSEEDESLLKILEQMEDWLYDHGEDESEQVYQEKLEELRKQMVTKNEKIDDILSDQNPQDTRASQEIDLQDQSEEDSKKKLEELRQQAATNEMSPHSISNINPEGACASHKESSLQETEQKTGPYLLDVDAKGNDAVDSHQDDKGKGEISNTVLPPTSADHDDKGKGEISNTVLPPTSTDQDDKGKGGISNTVLPPTSADERKRKRHRFPFIRRIKMFASRTKNKNKIQPKNSGKSTQLENNSGTDDGNKKKQSAMEKNFLGRESSKREELGGESSREPSKGCKNIEVENSVEKDRKAARKNFLYKFIAGLFGGKKLAGDQNQSTGFHPVSKYSYNSA